MKALRDAALSYADLGWHVLPLRPRGKAPLGALVPHGKDQASADLRTVLRWWTRAPQANIGLSCGASGFIVVDVDPRHGGDDTLHELERELGTLPETVEAETGGGGWHYLFRHPGGDLRGKLGEGVDLKDAGYIVAPPSIHPSGRPYAWGIGPDEGELAELPERWIERARAPRVVLREALEVNVDHADPLRRIPASVYVARLARREVHAGGWVQCPFHKNGRERTPSLKVDGVLWACYACDPLPGKRVLGGNIYDFAGLLAGYPIPLRGPDFLDVQARLLRFFGVGS